MADAELSDGQEGEDAQTCWVREGLEEFGASTDLTHIRKTIYFEEGGFKDRPFAAEGRECLCNELMANLGMPQLRPDGFQEPPLLTGGDDVERLSCFLGSGVTRYTAADVVSCLRDESSRVGSCP